MILEPITPTILSTRKIPNAAPAVLEAYGADASKHCALGLVTCDQDDPLYVALDECTKHANVDVVFAKSFFAGAAHASGPLSGEILGVIAAANPDEVSEGMDAILQCIKHDACFYDADGKGGVTVFPHVIASLGHYLSEQAGVAAGQSMAYLVAPPLEATYALDRALKSAEVEALKIFPPPSETNFAAAWLHGELDACEAAAMAFAEAVVDIANQPTGH